CRAVAGILRPNCRAGLLETFASGRASRGGRVRVLFVASAVGWIAKLAGASSAAHRAALAACYLATACGPLLCIPTHHKQSSKSGRLIRPPLNCAVYRYHETGKRRESPGRLLLGSAYRHLVH